MLIDRITSMADHLGIPTDVTCGPTESRACRILERLEALYLLDYCWETRPYLGARLAEVERRFNA